MHYTLEAREDDCLQNHTVHVSIRVCRPFTKGASEPQRVPTRLPASQSGGVSLLIRYHVEQGRGRALSGSGRPLARTSAGLARGSGGSRSQRSRVLHAIHCAAASPRPSKPRAWFADNRISLCASLRLPARRLLRARREAHPIGDRIEAPVQARQRCRRCPPEPSTRCRTLRNPFCAHAAGRSFHSAVRVSPSCRARDISLSTSRRTSTPHAIPTVHNPHSRCSRSSPRTPHWRSSRGPQAGTGLEPLCCVCGDMWGTLSPPYSCQSLDCVEGGDV